MSAPAPRRGPPYLLLAAGFLVLLVVGGATVWLTQGASPSIGGPFTLTNGAGKTVTDRDFRGRYMLVYFGYTFCPDVCPTTLNQVAGALDKLGAKADQVQPVFVTVDPERDDPAAVQQFVAAFSPRLVGLTGTPEQIAAVAREYRVYYNKHVTGPQPGDYTMDHSSILYLMGPDGRFIAPIRADGTADEIAAGIAHDMT